jgi:uncharacterized protein
LISDSRNILISGAGGFIGSRLTPALLAAGNQVTLLSRNPRQLPRPVLPWDGLHPFPLEGKTFQVAIHLAGEGLADKRWSKAQRLKIWESRVSGTGAMVETLVGSANKPKLLICASAVGFYGDRGAEGLTEESSSGDGFLAELCRAWEAACLPASEVGIRVVNLRMGAVLDPSGGALAKMLPVFRLGLGGSLGPGSQYLSWITLDDLVKAIQWCMSNDSLSGPVNMTSPEPVTNCEFTKTLARALRKPAVLPVPAAALRLALGRMADEVLLTSCRAIPARLLASGFQFDSSRLDAALGKLFAV